MASVYSHAAKRRCSFGTFRYESRSLLQEILEPRGLGELVRRLREGFGRGLRVAGAVGQGIGAVTDGMERGRGGLRAARHGVRRAFELADHRDQFELEQLQNLAGRIMARRRDGFRRRIWRRFRGTGRHGLFWLPLPKKTERHEGSLKCMSNS